MKKLVSTVGTIIVEVLGSLGVLPSILGTVLAGEESNVGTIAQLIQVLGAEAPSTLIILTNGVVTVEGTAGSLITALNSL